MANKSQADASAQNSKYNARIIVALILTIVALVFIFSNTGSATLRFLVIKMTMPAWAWFLVLLVIGVVIGSLFPWFRPKRRK